MAIANTTSQQIYDLLVSRDFDPNALDLMGKAAKSPSDADLFSFEYKTENRNYGTVVILVDSEQNMEVYFGDNVGKTMESNDKKDWYDFLYTLRVLAKRNLLTFSLNNLNRLKYNMKTIAAVTEGTLLEGYYGTSKTSYSNQPKKTKLVIKHSRPLGEGEQRFRNIQTLFVETEEGERFKLPFTNLTGGKAMARHVAEGGKPYDAFGQYIAEMMTELATLSRFTRATRSKEYNGDAQALAEQAVTHYKDLKRKAKRMIGRRGYFEELENFDPITVSEQNETVDAVREIFVQQSLDPRVEDALPILARIQEETTMREVDEFSAWADSIIEGTGPIASTPEEVAQLQELLSDELPVGPDATNASEALGFLLGGDDQLQDDLEELAKENPDADARPIIRKHMARLGISVDNDAGEMPQQESISEGHGCPCCGCASKSECTCPPDCPDCDCNAVEETIDIDTGKQALKAQRDPMLDDVDLERLKALLK